MDPPMTISQSISTADNERALPPSLPDRLKQPPATLPLLLSGLGQRP